MAHWAQADRDARRTPNEIDATAHGDVSVERAVLGRRPDQPPRIPWTPHRGDAQPSWIADAIAQWMFLLPDAPPAPSAVGATWHAKKTLRRNLNDGTGEFDITYRLVALEGCCASIELIATAVPDVIPGPGVTIRGTVRMALDGRVDEIRATLRYPGSDTVEDWTIRRR